MARVSNSTVFIKEEEIHWNINDFALMWNASGGEEVKSPDFQIGDKKCQLRISQIIHEGSIKVDGMLVEPIDNILALVAVNVPKEMKLTGGSLSIGMEGQKISGKFGDPTGKRIQVSSSSHRFQNQSSKVTLDGYYQHDYFRDNVFRVDFFCINRHATQVGIEVKLYVPSPIVSAFSQERVKDAGLQKLSTDLRAMLNRSAENADFSIECGGKTFPCHEFILRARSTVLEAMFQNKVTETSGRRMTVVDVGPETMAAFLEYLYTGGITAGVVNMKELIYIADKYDMEGLLEFCFRKLPEVEDHMVVDFLFMADKHNFVDYKKEAMLRIKMNKTKYMEDQNFVEKIQEVPHLLLELFKL